MRTGSEMHGMRRDLSCVERLRTMYSAASRRCQMKGTYRERLWEQQKGLCWLCCEPMIPFLLRHPLGVSSDHILPKSKGGSHKIGNRLLAHRDCNFAKADVPPLDLLNGISLSLLKARVISRLNEIHRQRIA